MKIGDGIYLLPGAERAAVRVLGGLDEEEFSVSAVRRALDTSRRVAVPLLELLARRGYTARATDGHHLTRAGRTLASTDEPIR